MHSQEPSTSLARSWGLAQGTTRGPRPRIDANHVAQRAVALADRDGLDAVSLARVAHACGVVTTALYRHVESKADLLDLMAEQALGPAPSHLLSGPDAVGAWIAAYSERLVQHPWLATMQPRSVPLGPQGLGWLDVLVQALRVRGVTDVAGVALQVATTVRAYLALRVSVVAPPAWWGSVVAERYPALAAEFANRNLADPDEDLAAALDRVLAGAAAQSA